MAESILRSKSKEFARKIIILCRSMKNRQVEYALISQILRSGTSIGANLHEAQYAQGDKDLISKIEIAQKECNETEYWLDLLWYTDSITQQEYDALLVECHALQKMMISTVKTMKAKLKTNN